MRIANRLAIIAVSCLAGCTPAAVGETGQLVILYGQRMNSELARFERSLAENAHARAQRSSARMRQSEADEAYVDSTRRVWRVSDNEAAEHLFRSVSESRASQAPLEITLSSEGATFEGKPHKPIYDPKPIEAMIKQIEALIENESIEDQARFAIEYAREVWDDVKATQDAATDQSKAAGREATRAAPGGG